jgi:dephospho-CoA kinase
MDEEVVVVVTGIPASGKTTLATARSAQLGWPLISKDVVKESLFEALGTGDFQWSQRLGRVAFGHLLELLADRLGDEGVAPRRHPGQHALERELA